MEPTPDKFCAAVAVAICWGLLLLLRASEAFARR